MSPLAGWTCPEPHGENPGRNNTFGYCVESCKDPCVAAPLLEAMRHMEWQNPHTGNVISVTMLSGGCGRRTFLERTEPYYMTPDRKLPLLRGNLVHRMVEAGGKELPGWIIEQNLRLPVTTKSGSWILSGTPDIIDPIRQVMYDCKTLQEYAIQKLVMGENKGKFSDHIPDQYTRQLNVYRYMGKKLQLFDVERLRLQIIAFGRLIMTGSAPELSFKKGFKWQKEIYHIPDIPLISDEQVEEIIEVEGDRWYRIFNDLEPAPIVDEGWLWLCKFCSFYKTKHCPDPSKEYKEKYKK